MLLSAKAAITGSAEHPAIHGCAMFAVTSKGTMVSVSVYNLPVTAERCKNGIFAMHIHEGGRCSGNAADSFADAQSHFDPENCPHPYHMGDMPPLFTSRGEAHMSYLTDRFSPEDIVGKVIIIHASPDDLHSQPSGNSGSKIACGVIEAV